MMNSFYKLPEGRFEFPQFLLSFVLIAAAFIGLGQLPITTVLYNKVGSNAAYLGLGEMADLLGKNYLLTLILIPFIICLLALIFAIKYIHRSNFKLFLSFDGSFDWKRIQFGAIVTICALAIPFGWEYFLSEEIVFNYQGGTFWSLLLVSLVLIPLQTTAEEMLFRSYLFKGLSFIKIPLVSILICGTLFGMMHAGNPEIDVLGKEALIFYVWSGLFLGVIVYLDSRMELALIYHAINNIFASVIVTTDWQAFRTDALFIDGRTPELGIDFWLTMFILQPIILVIFGKKYNWTFKSLLFNGLKKS